MRGYSLSDNNNTILRKLHIKLIQVIVFCNSLYFSSFQRLGTTFLPSKVLSWRYQRGSRSLEQTLSSAVTIETVAKDTEIKEEEEEEFDIPEEVEEILEVLLTGLKDKDTIVRWSAAKGYNITSLNGHSL